MKKKLFSKDYLLLWLGMAVSQLGDGAGTIGLMWWIQTNTGSALLLGTMAMVRSLISVLFSPLGGAVADRVNKKAIIVLTDTVRGLVYGTLAYLVYVDRLTPTTLLLLVAVSAFCGVFFNPTISATVPLLVSKENLARANSMQQITSSVVSILGYSAGGVLVALLGIPLLLAVDAASFLLSAASEMFICIPRLAARGKATASHFVEDIKAGLRYVRQNRVLIDLMKIAAVLNFVVAPIFILLPKYVQEHLGGTPALYGYMLAASMAGMLFASLLIAFTRVVQRNLWLFVHGITLQAGLLVTMALLPSNWHMAQIGIFLVTGFINGVVNIYFAVVIQRTTAPEQMGRVWGLINTMSGGLTPVSQGLTGYLGGLISTPLIYLVSGVLEGISGTRLSAIPNLRTYLSDSKEPALSEAEPALTPANE